MPQLSYTSSGQSCRPRLDPTPPPPRENVPPFRMHRSAFRRHPCKQHSAVRPRPGTQFPRRTCTPHCQQQTPGEYLRYDFSLKGCQIIYIFLSFHSRSIIFYLPIRRPPPPRIERPIFYPDASSHHNRHTSIVRIILNQTYTAEQILQAVNASDIFYSLPCSQLHHYHYRHVCFYNDCSHD